MRYTCDHGCTLDFRLSEPRKVCPTGRGTLQAIPPPNSGLRVWKGGCSGCLDQKDYSALAMQQGDSLRRGATRRLHRFVPSTGRGMFDASFVPGSGRMEITVNIFPRFIEGIPRDNAPPPIQKAYQELKPWTESEKLKFMGESAAAVADVWSKAYTLRHQVLGVPPWSVTPYFIVNYVSNEKEAHIDAEIKKIPPVDPNFFDCAGTWVGLQQISSGRPDATARASLSSESGKPVKLDAGLLGVTGRTTINYNVMAHEFGHMLGLPDEYENPVATDVEASTDLSKVLQRFGTLQLAADVGVPFAPFGSYTDSIMSRGDTVLRCHYITVWEALVLMHHDEIMSGAFNWNNLSIV